MKLSKTEKYSKIEKKFFKKHTDLILKYGEVLKKLQINPFDNSLKTDKLKGELKEFYASHLTYEYPPEERGVRNAFKTRCGDCGQYSALFITMARIAGIPARQQSGFNFYPGNTGAHVWSEIYLPVKGWVPVDATRDDGFLHLDNRRLIASLGLNIPLVNAPTWATFNNSEVEAGQTDFMQMFTLVSFGLKESIIPERTVFRSVALR